MRNLKLILTYDGTRYRGWQRLADSDNTIQGKLERTLSRLLEEPIELIGSGRTDAGTHALGQVANFHCNSPMSCQEILSKLRMYLPDDIGIRSCEEASPRFHARYNAKSKTYLYRIWNSDAPCVFQRGQVYRFEASLDLERMREAASLFLGTHDFRAFCSNKNSKKSTLRTLYSLEITRQDNEIHFVLNGDGFLYNMVRILVGTLLEVGMGKTEVGEIPAMLESRSRAAAGYTVPAHGLYLVEVAY